MYKVDRLSRSLLDFSQLLEFFDKREVSFVSVTQNFNTKTSMGRLTLNILLSFAQFEREIISERTRDKMAASRMKGKFIGGTVPFGYKLDKEQHVLVPDDIQAEQVRFIFECLLREENLVYVMNILQAKGVGLPEKRHQNGVIRPARPISRAYLYRIVHNPVYIGKVLYKGKIYEGEHEGLIPEKTFNAVQKLLAEKYTARCFVRKRIEGVLNGLLYCKACGSKMVPTYGKKNGRKHFFYYVCHKCVKEGYKACPTKTVRQVEFNEAVFRRFTERGLLNKGDFSKLDTDSQTAELMKIVDKITYEYKESYIEVSLKNGVQFGFRAEVKPHFGGIPKKERQAYKEVQKLKADKDTYYKALALQIREYMRVNNLSQKQCAQALGLSSARVSQILTLL